MEFTLLWAVLTAVALTWLGLRFWSEDVPEGGFDRLVGAGVAGLLVGRVAAMALQGINPITNPADLIIIRGGVHTGAATIAFIAVLSWSTRSTRHGLDALSPAILLGLAGWHAGCLWRGACLGVPGDLPWAWTLEGSNVTRHPVEIYAAVGLAAAAWLVSRLGWRLWLRAGIALAAAAAIRLLTEPLRPSITGGPTLWYWAGIVGGLVAVATGWMLPRSEATAPT
ncbi:MAG TPA: prolipoprotein diacylglyceryl transferase family protein [Acidimicrobiia bacterium]